MSHMSFMLCRQFIKGVGGGSKNEKRVLSKITLYFSFEYRLYNKLQNKSKCGLKQIFA